MRTEGVRSRLRGRRAAYIAVPTVVALGSGAVLASGAIPGADGTIVGCYKRSSGELRVVDRAAECRPAEDVLRWNQRGPQGPAGAAGPKGETGAKGDPGPAGPAGAGGGAADVTPGPDSDVFLKLDSIPGESTDQAHVNESPAFKFSQAATQTVSSGGGGGSTGRATIADMKLTKPVDSATPKIFDTLVTGRHLQRATVTFRRRGESSFEYLQYVIEDVIVSRHEVVTPTNNGGPVEEIALNFDRITIRYIPQRPDGTAGSPIIAAYSQSRGTS